MSDRSKLKGLLSISLFLIIFSVYISIPYFLVELKVHRASAGGGRTMLALFLGLPTLFSALVLQISMKIKKELDSSLNTLLLVLEIGLLLAWGAAFLLD